MRDAAEQQRLLRRRSRLLQLGRARRRAVPDTSWCWALAARLAGPAVCSFFLVDQKTLETPSGGGRSAGFEMYDIDGSREGAEARNYSF